MLAVTRARCVVCRAIDDFLVGRGEGRVRAGPGRLSLVMVMMMVMDCPAAVVYRRVT